MRSLIAVSTLFLMPWALLSQTTSGKVTIVQTPTIVLQAPVSESCPVGIEAHHSSQGAVVQVGEAAKTRSSGYNIALRSLNMQLIRQASVTLRGLAGHQIVHASDNNADATETFTLTPGDNPKAAFHSVVYTSRVTGVRWIELNEVTYADGTQWYQKSGSVCRVAPNGYLLVGANH